MEATFLHSVNLGWALAYGKQVIVTFQLSQIDLNPSLNCMSKKKKKHLLSKDIKGMFVITT